MKFDKTPDNRPEPSRYQADDLRQALMVLRQGGIILYPTDTVWGLGCDATNEKAVQRIYEIKKRQDSKAMLCLLDNAGKLTQWIEQVPDIAYDLVELTDKPLTIIYPNAVGVASNLVAEDGSLGIRITKELFSSALCRELRKPLVSTSANISGQPTAQNYSQIVPEIRNAVDYVVRYRRADNMHYAPSSIIKLKVNNEFEIIRK